MGTVLPHPTQLVQSTETIAEVLGFADVEETSKKSLDDEGGTDTRSTLPLKTLS